MGLTSFIEPKGISQLNTGFIYYLASPYSKHPAGLFAAYEDACKALACLLDVGVWTFAPIAHFHPQHAFRTGSPKDTYDEYAEINGAYMRALPAMIFLNLGEHSFQSLGMLHEVKYMRKLGKPIFEWNVEQRSITRWHRLHNPWEVYGITY